MARQKRLRRDRKKKLRGHSKPVGAQETFYEQLPPLAFAKTDSTSDADGIPRLALHRSAQTHAGESYELLRGQFGAPVADGLLAAAAHGYQGEVGILAVGRFFTVRFSRRMDQTIFDSLCFTFWTNVLLDQPVAVV